MLHRCFKIFNSLFFITFFILSIPYGVILIKSLPVAPVGPWGPWRLELLTLEAPNKEPEPGPDSTHSTDLNQTASRPPGPPVTMDSLRKPHGTGTNQNVKHVNGWDCSIWMHLVSDIASFARKNVGKSWDFSGQVWPEATIRLHKLTLRHPMVSKVRMDFK